MSANRIVGVLLCTMLAFVGASCGGESEESIRAEAVELCQKWEGFNPGGLRLQLDDTEFTPAGVEDAMRQECPDLMAKMDEHVELAEVWQQSSSDG